MDIKELKFWNFYKDYLDCDIYSVDKMMECYSIIFPRTACPFCIKEFEKDVEKEFYRINKLKEKEEGIIDKGIDIPILSNLEFLQNRKVELINELESINEIINKEKINE